MKIRSAAGTPAPPPVLPQQQADFTAEGAPPPGRAGLHVPANAATAAPEPAADATDSAAGAAANTAAPRRLARIVGEVESRQGDGANVAIRKGPCGVQLSALDATIDWQDGDARGSAVLPRASFDTHLRDGAIVYADGADD
jgi:hypothetical protein